MAGPQDVVQTGLDTARGLLSGIFSQEDDAREISVEAQILNLMSGNPELGIERNPEAAILLLRSHVAANVATEFEQLFVSLGPQLSEQFVNNFTGNVQTIWGEFNNQHALRSTQLRESSAEYFNRVVMPLELQRGQAALSPYESIMQTKNLLAQVGVLVKAVAETGLIDMPPEAIMFADRWINEATEYGDQLREQTELTRFAPPTFEEYIAEVGYDPEIVGDQSFEMMTGGMFTLPEMIDIMREQRDDLFGDITQDYVGQAAPAVPGEEEVFQPTADGL